MLAQECLQKRIRSFGHEICRGLLTIFIHLPAQRNLPTFLCVSHLTLETTSVLGVSPLSSLKIEALVGLLSLTIVPFHRVQSGVGICILRWGVGVDVESLLFFNCWVDLSALGTLRYTVAGRIILET